MNRPYRTQAEDTLGRAFQWARGPDAGPVIALIAIGQALLALHDLIETELEKEE